MSKRDALRALSRKFPAPQEVKSILEGLRDEPDRVVAIVGSAIAESFLERAIVSRLRYQGPELIGQLFNNRGPMADFHSKILIAQAFGVVMPPQASEFHRIKVIRNVFAHASLHITFETDEIAKEVDDFIMHKAMKKQMDIEFEKHGMDIPELSRKSTFLLMVQLSCIVIDHEQKEITGRFLGHYD
ncbi:MAG TPA: hypothetical protein VGP28_00080 [Methylocella sp.]|jgi:hypothetical protein|nr:hypothetical protein [Methylocella sp.]